MIGEMSEENVVVSFGGEFAARARQVAEAAAERPSEWVAAW